MKIGRHVEQTQALLTIPQLSSIQLCELGGSTTPYALRVRFPPRLAMQSLYPLGVRTRLQTPSGGTRNGGVL
jgi:hypothetical protein